jgi:hypothetical protein
VLRDEADITNNHSWTSSSSKLRQLRDETAGGGGGTGGVKRREVRDLHNSLERQRRVDLKNAFDTLKAGVPEVATSDKASKLLILTKARTFCLSLGSREAQLRKEKERERARHEALAKRVRLLVQQQQQAGPA